jgi:hypothetical protein
VSTGDPPATRLREDIGMKAQPALEKTQSVRDNHETTPRRPAHDARRREHRFYTGMAVAIALTVVAGFARTYYLRPLFGLPPLSPLLHLHGVVFSSWLLLFLTQSVLVASNRTRVHRRLGVAGAVLAVVMVVVGTCTAVIRAKQGATPVEGIDPLAFLVVPLGDMLVFSVLVASAIYFRRRPDLHKRLMLLAMISLMTAGVARLPLVNQGGPLAFFGATDLFVLACAAYDVTALKRVHRATLVGGLFVVASQPARLILASTPAWLAFAAWLTGWVG